MPDTFISFTGTTRETSCAFAIPGRANANSAVKVRRAPIRSLLRMKFQGFCPDRAAGRHARSEGVVCPVACDDLFHGQRRRPNTEEIHGSPDSPNQILATCNRGCGARARPAAISNSAAPLNAVHHDAFRHGPSCRPNTGLVQIAALRPSSRRRHNERDKYPAQDRRKSRPGPGFRPELRRLLQHFRKVHQRDIRTEQPPFPVGLLRLEREKLDVTALVALRCCDDFPASQVNQEHAQSAHVIEPIC